MFSDVQTPDARELGQARLQSLRDMSNTAGRMPLPAFGYPFTWGDCWKMCMEYCVDDFASEVGFFADILGLPVYAYSADSFMFTSPDGAFYFSVGASSDDAPAVPAGTIRLQFMIDEILDTTHELERRGISFEKFPEPYEPNSPLYKGSFRTPAGVSIDLWGMVEQKKERMW